jgi:hypothetical protein
VPCVSGLNAATIQDPNDKTYIYHKQPFVQLILSKKKKTFVQLISDIISGFNRKAFIGDTSFAE